MPNPLHKKSVGTVLAYGTLAAVMAIFALTGLDFHYDRVKPVAAATVAERGEDALALKKREYNLMLHKVKERQDSHHARAQELDTIHGWIVWGGVAVTLAIALIAAYSGVP